MCMAQSLRHAHFQAPAAPVRTEPENAECLSYHPDGSIAHSHHMAGDTRSCLGWQGVFLNEVNSTLAENLHRKTRGVQRSIKKFP